MENQIEKRMDNKMQAGIIWRCTGSGVSQTWGTFWVPHKKDYSILGSYWGGPTYGNYHTFWLSFRAVVRRSRV